MADTPYLSVVDTSDKCCIFGGLEG